MRTYSITPDCLLLLASYSRDYVTCFAGVFAQACAEFGICTEALFEVDDAIAGIEVLGYRRG